MPPQSWLGRALDEAALQTSVAVPCLAWPHPPPAPACVHRVLDRGLLTRGTEWVVARDRRRDFLSHQPESEAVVEVPERFVNLLLMAPYQACRHAEKEGLWASFDEEPAGQNRCLTLRGPAKAVEEVTSHIEGMLVDIHKKHGMPYSPQHGEPQWMEEQNREEASEELVRVCFDDVTEVVSVDKHKGPIWSRGRGLKARGPTDNGHWNGKDWKMMSSTEREVALITAARRQKSARELDIMRLHSR